LYSLRESVGCGRFEHGHMEDCVRNRLATEPVTLKVCNVKLSFDIWLVLYMYFILYS